MNGLADPMLQQQQPMMGMQQETPYQTGASNGDVSQIAQAVDQTMSSMPDTSSYSFANAILTVADQYKLDEKGIVETLIQLAATAPNEQYMQPNLGMQGSTTPQPNMMGLGGM